MQHSSEPRSVGLLSPGWPVEAMANGIVSYVSTVIGGMEKLGIRCHVLTPQLLQATADPNIHFVHLNSNSLRSKFMRRLDPEGWPRLSYCAAVVKELARLHREEGLQLLELEESFGWAQYLSRRCTLPLVIRLHGPWFLNGVANGAVQDAAFHRRDQLEKAGIVAATAVTAPSQDVLDQTRSHFGLALPNATVIPNPVEPVGSAHRWRLQDCDRNRIAFVGRFDRHKGGDTMIDAFAYILRQFPDARLDFVGPDRGCADHSGRQCTFEQYVQTKLSAADRQKVKYHGLQPGPIAAQLRRRALVTVAPSRYETFGIATAEGMMAACPLVVCGAGALTELIQHERNGLVASVADAVDVGEKVLSLLKNPDRAAQLGEQAGDDAAERYSTDVIARRTVDLYREVLQGMRK